MVRKLQKLLCKVRNLKNSEIKNLIGSCLTEFSEIRNRSINLIFKELCFCIMAANCSAKKCIEIQKKIDNGFLSLSETDLSLMLKNYKYRFYNIRSKYILEARNKIRQLEKNIKSNNNRTQLRE